MGKYDPLAAFLESSGAETVRLRFADIERILGAPLPFSARAYEAWWANESPPTAHVQCVAWAAAGYRVDAVDPSAEWVRFRRVSAVARPR